MEYPVGKVRNHNYSYIILTSSYYWMLPLIHRINIILVQTDILHCIYIQGPYLNNIHFSAHQEIFNLLSNSKNEKCICFSEYIFCLLSTIMYINTLILYT